MIVSSTASTALRRVALAEAALRRHGVDELLLGHLELLLWTRWTTGRYRTLRTVSAQPCGFRIVRPRRFPPHERAGSRRTPRRASASAPPSSRSMTQMAVRHSKAACRSARTASTAAPPDVTTSSIKMTRSPCLVGALDLVGGSVLLRLAAHDQKRLARGERGGRGERDRAELGAGEPLRVRLELGRFRRDARADRLEQLGRGLEAVLVEVVASSACPSAGGSRPRGGVLADRRDAARRRPSAPGGVDDASRASGSSRSPLGRAVGRARPSSRPRSRRRPAPRRSANARGGRAIVPASEPAARGCVPVSEPYAAPSRASFFAPLRARLRLPGLVAERAQAALQVVEDEADGRLGRGGRGDRALAVADEEHAALAASRPRAAWTGVAAGRAADRREQLLRAPSRSPRRVRPRAWSASDRAVRVEHDGGLDLRRDLGQVGEACAASIGRLDATTSAHRRRDVREVLRRPRHAPRGDDRLLRAALVRAAPVPRALAARLLRPRGRVELPRTELKRFFPSPSIDSIISSIRAIQRNATSLGIVGAAFLLWSSLSLFSVLESAFNIVYDRPNRSFLRGKALARRLHARARSSSSSSGCSSAGSARRCSSATRRASSRNAFVAYTRLGRWSRRSRCSSSSSRLPRLTNADARRRATCCPGRSSRTIALEATLPGAAGLICGSRTTSPAVQARRRPALLLVWLYVMANVIVFGAEVNWWHGDAAGARPSSGLA